MDFTLRYLEPGDYAKGYLELLEQLTTVGKLTQNRYLETYNRLRCIHYILVIEDLKTGRIVAAGTLFIEPKFIHQCGHVGHIEDVVVDKNYRGQHLGQRIVAQLQKIGDGYPCYKTLLDCSESNIKFYQKCGFQQKGVCMVRYKASL